MTRRIGFSPTEEAVLDLLIHEWNTRHEVKRVLFPTHSPESVTSAIAYLRRHELVTELPRGGPDGGPPFLEVTPLGEQVYADFKQSRRPVHLEAVRHG